MSSLIEPNETLHNRIPISEEEKRLGDDDAADNSDDAAHAQQLWNIRLPRNAPSLKGVTSIPLDGTSFTIKSRRFKLVPVSATTSTSNDMRMLVGDNDEKDEDEDEQYFLKLAKPFHRHFVLVEEMDSNSNVEQDDDNNNNDDDGADIKRAYTTVPQVQHMKRRWTVPGQFAFDKEDLQTPPAIISNEERSSKKIKIEQKPISPTKKISKSVKKDKKSVKKDKKSVKKEKRKK